jgi:DNA-binding response OmpR family regulator
LLSPPPHLPQGAHIVVADEKPALLDMMVRTLRADDHRVFQAFDGQAAFELALALDIDLLITNTRMPGLNGAELIRHVRALLPTLPILHIQNQGEVLDRGPDGIPADVPTLSEPFTAEQLLAAVRPLLQRSTK